MFLQVTQRRIVVLLALTCLAVSSGLVGCATTKKSWKYAKGGDYKRAVGLKSDKPLPPAIPTRVVSTWAETVLQQTGKTPQRGFGGRFLFFKAGSEDPIRVDGQLVVYAWDETDREKHDTHPTRKYVFPREEFARHESESQLGSSYSIWLPWDEVGGKMKQISLIAKFEPHEGTYVMGEQTKHLLPGLSNRSTEHLVGPSVGPVEIAQHTEKTAVQNAVKPTSAEMPLQSVEKAETKSDSSTKDSTMSTTTIALPKKWEKRLSTGAK
jgi:hypothetical protein